MNTMTAQHSHERKNGSCTDVAEFSRLNYFYGQMLSAQDFKTEQSFFREKMKLHNRCLHGYGTVCGLLVEPLPMPKECQTPGDEEIEKLREELKEMLARREAQLAEQLAQAAPGPAPQPGGAPQPAAGNVPAPAGAPAADLGGRIDAMHKKLDELYKKYCKPEPRTHLRLTCGLALDCQGNELVLRESMPFDPLRHVSKEDHEYATRRMCTLWVSLCYCEEPTDPVRPVLPDICGATPECAFSKTRDSVRIKVTTSPPEHDERCENCCDCCRETCVLLARVDHFIPGEPVHHSQIHNGVRRPLSTYQPTTITGISWRQGHVYTQEEAKRVLGTDHDEHPERRGLEIYFSRPVRASTIHPGVLDVWVIEGGRGRHGGIYHKDGHFVHKPKDGYVDRILFRDSSEETLQPGDRVLIILRTNFILDRCCRPVDGDHIGGRVPLLPEYHAHHGQPFEYEECAYPPGRPGPWTSGNGTPGGTFESWFWIREDEGYRKGR